MSGSSSSRPGANPAVPDEPLGLTVHSLPLPQEAVAADAQRTQHGRWKMLAVLLVCAAPVVASYFTYYVVRPEGRRNYGELIDPQRPLPDVATGALGGERGNLRDLKGQWLLVSVAGGACTGSCEKHLYLQRQLREGLGKNKDRLDWVWLIPDTAAVPAALQAAVKAAEVRRVDAAQLAQWLVPASGHALPDHLYLVDPLGNWMMRFPALKLAGGVDTEAAASIKRDLERLMRASAAWDQPGRAQ